VARDGEGLPTGMLDGYRPGDAVVRVFTYQADPAGRDPVQIAEEAFAICNGHPRDAAGELSYPGNSPCCSSSCCTHRAVVWRTAGRRMRA